MAGVTTKPAWYTQLAAPLNAFFNSQNGTDVDTLVIDGARALHLVVQHALHGSPTPSHIAEMFQMLEVLRQQDWDILRIFTRIEPLIRAVCSNTQPRIDNFGPGIFSFRPEYIVDPSFEMGFHGQFDSLTDPPELTLGGKTYKELPLGSRALRFHVDLGKRAISDHYSFKRAILKMSYLEGQTKKTTSSEFWIGIMPRPGVGQLWNKYTEFPQSFVDFNANQHPLDTVNTSHYFAYSKHIRKGGFWDHATQRSPFKPSLSIELSRPFHPHLLTDLEQTVVQFVKNEPMGSSRETAKTALIALMNMHALIPSFHFHYPQRLPQTPFLECLITMGKIVDAVLRKQTDVSTIENFNKNLPRQIDQPLIERVSLQLDFPSSGQQTLTVEGDFPGAESSFQSPIIRNANSTQYLQNKIVFTLDPQNELWLLLQVEIIEITRNFLWIPSYKERIIPYHYHFEWLKLF